MGEDSNYMTGVDFWSSASYAVSVKGGRKMETITEDRLLAEITDALASGDTEMIEQVADMLLHPAYRYIGDSVFAVFRTVEETK